MRVHCSLTLLVLLVAGCGTSGTPDDNQDPCASYAGLAGPGWQCMGGAEPLTNCTMSVGYNDLAEDCALRCLFTACFAHSILDETIVDGEVQAFVCANGYPDAPIVCHRGDAPLDGGLPDASECTPENDAEFCAQQGANCGSVTAADNCGVTRTVASCGMGPPSQICAGEGVANVCGLCTPSCSGLVCGDDGCGGSCGTCAFPQSGCEGDHCCSPYLGQACSVDSDCCQGRSCGSSGCCIASGSFCDNDGQCCSGNCSAASCL